MVGWNDKAVKLFAPKYLSIKPPQGYYVIAMLYSSANIGLASL